MLVKIIVGVTIVYIVAVVYLYWREDGLPDINDVEVNDEIL